MIFDFYVAELLVLCECKAEKYVAICGILGIGYGITFMISWNVEQGTVCKFIVVSANETGR